MRESKVLLLSDDIEATRPWAYVLGRGGIRSVVADFTRDRPEDYLGEPSDLILFDVVGAVPAALAVCRKLRSDFVDPILMMAYFSGEPQVLEAYEAGIDDCMGKPVGLRLLPVKLQAWMRRAWTVPTEAMVARESGGLRLDPERRELRLADGREIGLTNLELRLLYVLMIRPGQVLDAALLIDRVWGFDSAEPAALKSLVYRLRRKIEPDPAHPQRLCAANGGYVFSKG
jgi:DNA-binding response OmpR family regulator